MIDLGVGFANIAAGLVVATLGCASHGTSAGRCGRASLDSLDVSALVGRLMSSPSRNFPCDGVCSVFIRKPPWKSQKNGDCMVQEFRFILWSAQIFVWVNFDELATTSLESGFLFGKSSPNGRKIQVSETLSFIQICAIHLVFWAGLQKHPYLGPPRLDLTLFCG